VSRTALASRFVRELAVVVETLSFIVGILVGVVFLRATARSILLSTSSYHHTLHASSAEREVTGNMWRRVLFAQCGHDVVLVTDVTCSGSDRGSNKTPKFDDS
jgi:hypothetical protein